MWRYNTSMHLPSVYLILIFVDTEGKSSSISSKICEVDDNHYPTHPNYVKNKLDSNSSEFCYYCNKRVSNCP